jgi:hypothetical protein
MTDRGDGGKIGWRTSEWLRSEGGQHGLNGDKREEYDNEDNNKEKGLMLEKKYTSISQKL